MIALEAFICGAEGDVLGGAMEIGSTSHQKVFLGIEADDYPVLSRMSDYSKNTLFNVDIMDEMESEIKNLLEKNKNDGLASGLLISLLSLVHDSKRLGRPIRIKYNEIG
jgi:hypothetical protein